MQVCKRGQRVSSLASVKGLGLSGIWNAHLHRYFEGIQGDTAKRGELFGIENIFKLHEDKLATKMAVRYLPSSEDATTLTVHVSTDRKS